jgi:hypothetical protein
MCAAPVSELSLTSITIRAYFAQDYIADNELNSAAHEAFQSLSSAHATNITKQHLKEDKFHSVEEAIYEALFNETTMEIISQSSCPLSNWIVSTDCLVLTLSRVIHFYDNDYFVQQGQGVLTKLVDYHSSTAFESALGLDKFETALKSSQQFHALNGIRSNVILPQQLVFEDQFIPVLNSKIYYDIKTEREFSTMVKGPASIFFYSTLGFLIGSMFVIWNDRKYEKNKKLLNSHFNTVSRAMLEKSSSKESEVSVINTDLDLCSLH